jgi:hypothetical protein
VSWCTYESSGIGQEPVADSCESGNERWGSTKKHNSLIRAVGLFAGGSKVYSVKRFHVSAGLKQVDCNLLIQAARQRQTPGHGFSHYLRREWKQHK